MKGQKYIGMYEGIVYRVIAELHDDPPELSMQGVGTKFQTTRSEHWGQCQEAVGRVLTEGKLDDRIDGATVIRIIEIWERWHLNHTRAGCEHQRAARWVERPIDPQKSLGSYGKFFSGQRTDSWNMLVWVSREEHPEGLLSHPCSLCGHKYGHSWIKEELPKDVIEFVVRTFQTS